MEDYKQILAQLGEEALQLSKTLSHIPDISLRELHYLRAKLLQAGAHECQKQERLVKALDTMTTGQLMKL